MKHFYCCCRTTAFVEVVRGKKFGTITFGGARLRKKYIKGALDGWFAVKCLCQAGKMMRAYRFIISFIAILQFCGKCNFQFSVG